MKGLSISLILSGVLFCTSTVTAKDFKKDLKKRKSDSRLHRKIQKKESNIKTSESLYKINPTFSSWGLSPKIDSSINVVEAWKKFKLKKEVVVAVVDTGIDAKHPFLKDNLYLPGKSVKPNQFGIDFSKDAKNKYAPADQHGHGTHISGIIRSIFPDVKILSLKYYSPNVKNKDNLTSTVKALEYAIEQNVDIINYSSGGAGASIDELRVLKKAEKKGILVVAAAGNEASNIDSKENFYFPASYKLKNMITVINHDKKGTLNVSSNWGERTADISAPGSRINSAYTSSSGAGHLTGTSQSTAFVTGVAALLMSQYPTLSVEDIKKIILESSRKTKKLAGKCKSGGMLDAKAAQGLAMKKTQEHDRKLAHNSEFKTSKAKAN
ncbi:MAG: S8 family serine peptidase [Bacteriovoracaceae bacterium]